MSTDTADGRRPPIAWPADHAATEVLHEWVDGPEDAHMYACELDFRGADLTDLGFYYLVAIECDFSGTVLVRTDVAGSYLADTDFTGADLTDAVLFQAQVTDCVFDQAVLRRANLRDVDLRRVSFAGADLSEADIEGYVANCDFTGADLRGAHLDAIFTRAVVTNVRVDGARGSIYGPIVVRENGEDTLLHEREAEEWLAARGADITVMASSVPGLGGRDGQPRPGDTSERGSRRSRTTLLLFDLVAVLVFTAFRWSGSAEDLMQTLVAAVPFLAGAVVGGAAVRSWRAPLSWRAGLATWAGAVVVGLAVYAAFIGRLPPAFAGITIVELGVLILVWRALALIVLALGLDRRAALHAHGASDDDPQAAGNRGVIDLDESLERASRTGSAHWGEDQAAELARRLTDALALRVDFEPPDEEWARLLGRDACHGMISVRLPVALVTRFVASTLAGIAPDVAVVLIDGFVTESLRGSPELLRTTVLPYGWDVDFDPEAFSANDLFVESI